MIDPIRAALERLQEYATAHPEHDTDRLLAAALAAEPVDGLSPKETEAQQAFTQMRDEVLSGVEGLDSDQINSILYIIDNHTPEWV